MTQINVNTNLVNAYKRKLEVEGNGKITNKDMGDMINEWLEDMINL